MSAGLGLNVDRGALNLDEVFMHRAIDEARKALARGDVPVGAVIVSGANQREREPELLGWGSNVKTNDPTAHAEIQAIRMAASRSGHWNLGNCTLYVTLEPCPMCAGACLASRITRVVFGASDPRAGAAGTLYDLLRDTRLNHRCLVTGGVLKSECVQMLQDYFLARRAKSK